ncbi:cyclin-dependent kinase inhibitor 3 [Impatiens glandulifera]|uniref:cyclin-dependent kinase inhibitor 3 n=1 Tax=Impatiens glandulifera TaxID=253017 RepID=UPI001FB0EE24|nr:cyclin-dependent kinase inhibitor 3 [Impatiens glandulifera]
MGKYMRKAKISGDVTVMDLAQPSFGVRTRAKTLALQKLQSPPESTYLQLRSRRLEKLLPSVDDSKKLHLRKQQDIKHLDSSTTQNPSSRLSPKELNSVSVESCSKGRKEKTNDGFISRGGGGDEKNNNDFGVETSSGENHPSGFRRRERMIEGSSDASLCSTTRLRLLERNHHVVTTWEMDEFFSGSEELEQKQFSDKYNFDVVNDMPLPGRFEWVRVEP